MNVLPEREQLEIQHAVAEFLLAECPASLVRRCEDEGADYARSLWRTFSELGWLTLSLPAEYGGQALPLSHLGLMFEEIGRHIAPLPILATLVSALTIARHGDEVQRQILTSVGQGESILSFAVQESDGVWREDAIHMRARREADHYVLNGTKHFVDHFGESACCLVVCRLDDGELGILLVDPRTAGVSTERLVPLAKDGQTVVRFEQVRVPVERLLGAQGQSAEAVGYLMDLAAVFSATLMQGAARRAMEIAVDYVNHRDAFGQPIGSFQAIQHMAADMLNAVDGTQLLAREALWRLDAGLPASVEVSQAKAFANEHCLRVVRCAQQMHGGLGFITECDINLWYRRVASWSLRAGTVYEHRERVAQALLDAPGLVRLDTPIQWKREARA
ncbi:acyl-CoA dehydrogenase family protein [Paraburkholderia sp. BCC1886]|uniref:acyl-CoA dehydrogenase family protein n=1 Tax=Paraburkholderia sp. BCC1886 TaxID=2562670 RepID=UPI0011833925|nr:acyl-CoA dehydrogenase family protein [Paraburkholderia sp. BCC1886]